MQRRTPEDDPDGSRLRHTLESHLAYERARDVRRILLHMLLFPGMALWASCTWPSLVGERLRGFALYAWALGCVVLLFAAASEWRWLKVREQLTADLARRKER